MKTQTREQYLERALALIQKEAESVGYDPVPAHVSIGFAKGRGAANGQCYDPAASKDRIAHIFVAPTRDGKEKADDILLTLVHEYAHAVVGVKEKHGPKFRHFMRSLGATSSTLTCSESEPKDSPLRLLCWDMVSKLGAIPHPKLNINHGLKKQTTRLRKIECESCGYMARVTKKWLDKGLPTCCCGGNFRG